MPKVAGQLLWNRVMTEYLLPAKPTPVSTGLTQKSLAFGSNQPNLAQRVMVIPMAPMSAWDYVTHGDPYVDTDGTITVDFTYGGQDQQGVYVNVLFWAPHTGIGPGSAVSYLVP